MLRLMTLLCAVWRLATGAVLQRYTPPLLIDEIQYAPQLLSYIKMYADNGAQNGDIWLTGSQRLPLMQGVTESLAGRVGIIDLQGLSANEINGTDNTKPFLPEVELLFNRMNHAKKQSLKEIYKLIWQGSMPAMYNGGEQDWQSYYASYVQTFLQRDVMKLLQINDEMVFFRFLCAAAGQTGKMINYAELAKAAEISAPTAKQWIKTLEAAGIIYLLQPFMPPGAKYIVKAPKLYFFDTGLAAYLTRCLTPMPWRQVQQALNFLKRGLNGNLQKLCQQRHSAADCTTCAILTARR